MRLPSFKRIYENNFKEEYKDLVRTLSASINIGLENLYLALNNRLTFQDNFQATIKQLDVIVNSSGYPIQTTVFQLNNFGGTQTQSEIRAIGVLVINAQNLTNSSIYPTNAPFVSWTQVQTGIQINHVTGLQSGQTYRLTLLAI